MDLLISTDRMFAMPDPTRPRRTGIPEAIYAPGKTPAEIVALLASATSPVRFVTRVGSGTALHCLRWQPTGLYYPRPRLLAFGQAPQLDSAVAILTAGTADLPVALEARAVLSHLGVRTLWLPDRGVASPRRSLAAARAARAADCAIVVAGFDAALPSVVAALLDRPVIAVPTSTGYGTAAEGRAPLWAALSSCADGLTVVNVDNGYGAACAAYRIVHEHVRRG